jgi:hypothetical protein
MSCLKSLSFSHRQVVQLYQFAGDFSPPPIHPNWKPKPILKQFFAASLPSKFLSSGPELSAVKALEIFYILRENMPPHPLVFISPNFKYLSTLLL